MNMVYSVKRADGAVIASRSRKEAAMALAQVAANEAGEVVEVVTQAGNVVGQVAPAEVVAVARQRKPRARNYTRVDAKPGLEISGYELAYTRTAVNVGVYREISLVKNNPEYYVIADLATGNVLAKCATTTEAREITNDLRKAKLAAKA